MQVNGKLRGKVSVAAEASKDEILTAAKGLESVKPWIDGKKIVKELYVEKKLVNLVAQ